VGTIGRRPERLQLETLRKNTGLGGDGTGCGVPVIYAMLRHPTPYYANPGVAFGRSFRASFRERGRAMIEAIAQSSEDRFLVQVAMLREVPG